MDPKEVDALEIIGMAERFIRREDFRIARNLLKQAEEIFPTVKAHDLLAFITNEIGPDPRPGNSRSGSTTSVRRINIHTKELCPKRDELLTTTENEEAATNPHTELPPSEEPIPVVVIPDIDKLTVAVREERAAHHRATAREFMRIGDYDLAKLPLAHAECFMPSQENKQLWAELVSKASCLQPEEEFILDPSQPLFSLLFSAGRENK